MIKGNAPLKLVLFINGRETYDSYPFPLPIGVELTHPCNVYGRLFGDSSTDGLTLDDFEHDYRIMYVEKE